MNCTKKDFLTRRSAQQFKRQNRRKYGTQTSVYKCPECSVPERIVFHLTTQDRAKRKIIRAQIYGE